MVVQKAGALDKTKKKGLAGEWRGEERGWMALEETERENGRLGRTPLTHSLPPMALGRTVERTNGKTE